MLTILSGIVVKQSLMDGKKRECAVLHKVNTTGWLTGCSESESKINHYQWFGMQKTKLLIPE